MKLVKISLAFLILQLFFLCHVIAENLNAVRVIVNGEIITEFDIRQRMAEAFAIAEQDFSGTGLERRKSGIVSDAIEELINRRLLVQKAKKHLLANPEIAFEIEKRLEEFVKGAVDEVGSVYKFYELANKQGINPATKKIELREDMMVDELMRENVYRKVMVTPKEIRKYFQSHADEFSEEGKLSFRQILIKFSAYDTQEEAKSEAEGLLSRLKDGEAFDNIAKEHSNGPHAQKGGLWEFDEVRDFRKDFVKVVSMLKKDELSEIIRSSIGYHIFKIEEMISAQNTTFQEVQKKVYNEIFREKFYERKKEYLQELKKDATIVRHY